MRFTGRREKGDRLSETKQPFCGKSFPSLSLGFLLISLLASLSVFNKDQVNSLANLSRWAFLLTFAGVA
jgi:uncharacterized membrane protein YadS